MKLVGLDHGASNNFSITATDREWAEENFRWLIEVFGYPNKLHGQVLLSNTFFPKTYSNDSIYPDDVVTDLKVLMSLEKTSISVQMIGDIRAMNATASQKKVFECETEIVDGQYRIVINNALAAQSERFIHCLVFEFIKIRLNESEIEYDSGGDDTRIFTYLAGIYYGFGVILSQKLSALSNSSNQINWDDSSDMPVNVMAFSLATYAHLIGDENPQWKALLPPDFQARFDGAIRFIKDNPNEIFNARELQATDLFNQADAEFDQHDLDAALSTLQKILFITNDDHLKADVYNNMGYYHLRKKNYQKGITAFRNALALGPEYGYANDNLGYALIMVGDLEEGKYYIDKAMQTKNNDVAYSFRNMALYHVKKNEPLLAETFFQKAFQEQTPVDLLDFHYATFLISTGNHELGLQYLRKAFDKNEQEAIELMNTLNTTFNH